MNNRQLRQRATTIFFYLGVTLRAHSFVCQRRQQKSSFAYFTYSRMKMASSTHHRRHNQPTEEREDMVPFETDEQVPTADTAAAVWDPIAQIYVGGKVPENNFAVSEVLNASGGYLRVFGYGSLCWNPGDEDSPLAHATTTTGQVRGYRRAWAQKSTDHRGVPSFPGIVCTLLTDEEFQRYRPSLEDEVAMSITEGLIYKVPPELVQECLEDLDFREKGGYARDVIEVVEDESGETVKALLYRGTPDNPAFWPRALRDLSFAAAVMATARGPSGENYEYLQKLDQFLERVSSCPTILQRFDDTFDLTTMAKMVREQEQYDVHFLCGCGSNQHNQLLLKSTQNVAHLRDGEDALCMNEIVLCIPRLSSWDALKNLYAGGGHSGILTQSGQLHLFGWNHTGQLASSGHFEDETVLISIPCVRALADILVEKAALGFSHTLIIEKETQRLFAFGDNSRGQVGESKVTKSIAIPTVPLSLESERLKDIAAGLFHSAAVTDDGSLLTFGCSRFGQSFPSIEKRWKPDDGARIIQVACGRRHTVALDENGRVWTFGENKYFQLGRPLTSTCIDHDGNPGLVEFGSPSTFKCLQVLCGWSHTILLVEDSLSGSKHVLGFGRNDRGQLGIDTLEKISTPTRLFTTIDKVQSVSCGSEWTVVVDELGTIMCCGWNEHLSMEETRRLTPIPGSAVVTPPNQSPLDCRLSVAAGGAHLIAGMVIDHN
jgi:alpha-tubulin suppressor-like RCC1 family protein/cation transport regulator ChaC